MKPALEAPGTKRLKLIYDGPPSNCAFKFNLRRYNQVLIYLDGVDQTESSPSSGTTIGNGQASGVAPLKIGYFGDGDDGDACLVYAVGRCRLTP
jgi:hypothetical protein